jgi:hypothetical protein
MHGWEVIKTMDIFIDTGIAQGIIYSQQVVH